MLHQPKKFNTSAESELHIGAKGVVFSACGAYRYLLWRLWNRNLPALGWILLNPSTASAEVDDPTLRRCLDYTYRWGFGSLWLFNVFALRSSSPQALRTCPDPVGPFNDDYLSWASTRCNLLLAGWGNHGRLYGRSDIVRSRFTRLHCLRLTAQGQPAHPLYLPKNLQIQPW